jgi:hypothetical protein
MGTKKRNIDFVEIGRTGFIAVLSSATVMPYCATIDGTASEVSRIVCNIIAPNLFKNILNPYIYVTKISVP